VLANSVTALVNDALTTVIRKGDPGQSGEVVWLGQNENNAALNFDSIQTNAQYFSIIRTAPNTYQYWIVNGSTLIINGNNVVNGSNGTYSGTFIG